MFRVVQRFLRYNLIISTFLKWENQIRIISFIVLVNYRINDTVFDPYLFLRVQLLLECKKRCDVLLYTLSLRWIIKLGKWSATVTTRLRISTLLCDDPLHPTDVRRSNSVFWPGNLLLQRNRFRKLPCVVQVIYLYQDLRNELIIDAGFIGNCLDLPSGTGLQPLK